MRPRLGRTVVYYRNMYFYASGITVAIVRVVAGVGLGARSSELRRQQLFLCMYDVGAHTWGRARVPGPARSFVGAMVLVTHAYTCVFQTVAVHTDTDRGCADRCSGRVSRHMAPAVSGTCVLERYSFLCRCVPADRGWRMDDPMVRCQTTRRRPELFEVLGNTCVIVVLGVGGSVLMVVALCV